MLLTKDEREKIKSYIEYNLIVEHQAIIDWMEDTETEREFINCMINKNYASAFKICVERFNVHSNSQFMSQLLNLFYPSVKRDWAKYFILVQTSTFDDFALFDKCMSNERKAFTEIYKAVYI